MSPMSSMLAISATIDARNLGFLQPRQIQSQIHYLVAPTRDTASLGYLLASIRHFPKLQLCLSSLAGFLSLTLSHRTPF
ncbi:hypothetical protein M434DRAFT_398528 [Hypoxylon sp. CO27-5]|nr:hypothetical protein M434DRAFT_398528 [Hypoxylon sp. CO27-5]